MSHLQLNSLYIVFAVVRRLLTSAAVSPSGRLALSAVTMVLISVDHADAAVLTGPIINPANLHHYYLLDASGWTAAQAEALTLGGSLATIDNAAEQQWVYSTFSTFGGVDRNLWIGLYDSNAAVNATQRADRRAEFQWISGAASAYRNWSPVEPNNPQTTDPATPELYAHIWNPADPNAGTWNNYLDLAMVFGRPVNGVVEIASVPEPSGAALLMVGAIGLRRLRRGKR
jgi:hypothetical protein